MNDFEFTCSGGASCPRDSDGNIIVPTDGPMMTNGNMNVTNQAAADPADPSAEQTNIVTPPEGDFNTEAFVGSMQQILSDNLGQYVVIEFLIGTQGMTTKQGILYAVGRSYVVLYEEVNRNYVVCDIFSVKFVTFYLPGERPAMIQNTPAAAMNNGNRMRR